MNVDQMLNQLKGIRNGRQNVQNVYILYAKEHVLKDDGYGHPPIHVGKLSNGHVRPLCAHVLVGCYDNKEVIVGDVHNGTTKRWDL